MGDKLELIITCITTGISIVSIILSIVYNNKKTKSQKIVELAKVVQKLPGYITEAESIFGAGTGTAKMAYVLNKVQIDCLTSKIEYNEEQIKGEIENILATPEKKGESNVEA